MNKVQAQDTQGKSQIRVMQNRSQKRHSNFCECFTPFPPYVLKLSRLRHPVILGQILITSVGLQYGVRIVFVYKVWFFKYNDRICVSFENQMREIWFHSIVWSHIKAERWRQFSNSIFKFKLTTNDSKALDMLNRLPTAFWRLNTITSLLCNISYIYIYIIRRITQLYMESASCTVYHGWSTCSILSLHTKGWCSESRNTIVDVWSRYSSLLKSSSN